MSILLFITHNFTARLARVPFLSKLHNGVVLIVRALATLASDEQTRRKWGQGQTDDFARHQEGPPLYLDDNKILNPLLGQIRKKTINTEKIMVLGKRVAADMLKGKAIITGSSSIADIQKKFFVLIADDNSLIRMLHQMIVTRLGMEAHLVENGQQTVDLHRAGASFDLILMDMEMPVMDGVEATKELRAMGVETVIVGVTACPEGPERQAFVEAGLNDCYTKPLKEENLAALVQVIKATKEKVL